MGGPDLEKWLENLPGAVGEEIGRILRRRLEQGGELTAADEAQLKEMLTQDEALVSAAYKSLVEVESASRFPNRTVIDHYLTVLNTAAVACKELSKPIVLRGFFHDAECLSSIDFSGLIAGSQPFFKIGPSADQTPEFIYISEGVAKVLDTIQGEGAEHAQLRLNREISGGEFPILLGETVEMVWERAVNFYGGESARIPVGAPGAIRMLESLPLAISAQREHEDKLSAAMERFNRD
jgi:hypothetical protein